MIIQLAEHEIADVLHLAAQLSEKHARKGFSQYVKSSLGLLGEYAAARYMNEALGANPKVQFNWEYSDSGYDGGKDFEWKGLTWDVKTNRKHGLLTKYAHTKADILIKVMALRGDRDFYVQGWIPRSRIEGDAILPVHLRDMADLAHLWPESITICAARYSAKRMNHPVEAGVALQGVLGKAMMALAMAQHGHKVPAGEERRARR